MFSAIHQHDIKLSWVLLVEEIKAHGPDEERTGSPDHHVGCAPLQGVSKLPIGDEAQKAEYVGTLSVSKRSAGL
ncbi:hypothetical protein GUJ93_ZPchr0013g35523 [Zizania palustris]|uniref:Uncharacterized protein n=1 Tax=Zizania palustris TaxID=103762 RepID=A0A8J5X2U9_ZIZPA|nr:hypothetical protein GUJ93_ZPchr0013g35523 [Zizania palustris]